jgi:cellulose synthase/poly-beta-1,6-N-acetylglucosamine synthase-like glycosyltransferase
MKVIHHFAEPGIGMVQTRWTHLNRDYSMLTQIEAILLDGHFVLEHGARARTGDFFNFNGTAGMWRIQAIDRRRRLAARHPHRRHRPQLPLADGRLEVQIPPDVECPAELPIEMTAFKTQQARWAKGLIQTSIKVLPRSSAPTSRAASRSRPSTTSPPTSATRSWSSCPRCSCPP